PRTGGQYYGILDDASVPAVIAEGAYIANPSEGELLETPEFQQAYADAMYRALVRFLTTDDPGRAPSHDPEVWYGTVFRGGPHPDCQVPQQD
ncbi:MAG: N-acetylmuramoyl-L-alanine amidase, partial [Acidimicrobiia bacterium]